MRAMCRVCRLAALLVLLAVSPGGASAPPIIYFGEYAEFQVDIPDQNGGEGWFAFGIAQRDLVQPSQLRVSGMFCTDYEFGVSEPDCHFINKRMPGLLNVSDHDVNLRIPGTPLGALNIRAILPASRGVLLTYCPAAYREWQMTIDSTTFTAADTLWKGTIGGRKVVSSLGCNYYEAHGVAQVFQG